MSLLSIQKDAVEKFVGVIVVFTGILMMFDAEHFNGMENEGEGISDRLGNRLYFVLTTLSSVGYGDITPATNTTRLITASMMMTMLLSIV